MIDHQKVEVASNVKKHLGPRIIVALDYPCAQDALNFVDRLSPDQCRVKIGLELYTIAGPSIVRILRDKGFYVFLDLKFHDIPSTVSKACAQAAQLDVWMLNVHALGGRAMLEAAREAVNKVARPPLLIGVTLLTSHGQQDLPEIGLSGGIEKNTAALASLVQACNLDGVVCSGWEAAALKERMGNNFILVTPGIRPAQIGHDDQKRVLTPQAACKAGSDYLVIGRAITQAKDPAAMLEEINRQIR